jgi:hypothetical protein
MSVPKMPLADVRRVDFEIPHQIPDPRTTVYFLFHYRHSITDIISSFISGWGGWPTLETCHRLISQRWFANSCTWRPKVGNLVIHVDHSLITLYLKSHPEWIITEGDVRPIELFELLNGRIGRFRISMTNRGSCQFPWRFALLIWEHRTIERSCEFDLQNWRYWLTT